MLLVIAGIGAFYYSTWADLDVMGGGCAGVALAMGAFGSSAVAGR